MTFETVEANLVTVRDQQLEYNTNSPMSPSSLGSSTSTPLAFPSEHLHRNQLSIQSSLLPAKTPSSSFPTKSLTLPTIKPFKSLNSSMSASATTKPESKIFDAEEDVAIAIARYTSELSDKYAKERGAFTVVFSGGSLIKSLRKLVESPYIDSIEWAKWHVFWVDERVVPKDHADSNYKLAYDGFLSKVPIPTGQVYAINDALSAEGAADDYETCLKHLVKNRVIDLSPATGFPKFDLMLIGMGPDGHVASLFPGHPLVKENQRWIAHILDSPKPPPERITFTFPVINSSAKIALVVCGAGKSDVVGRALGSATSSDLLRFKCLPQRLQLGFWTKMQHQSFRMKTGSLMTFG